MKISQLIEKLQQLQAQHGDLVVAVNNAEFMQHRADFRVELAQLDEDMDGLFDPDQKLPATFISIAES